MQEKISLVIPCYNEQDTLPILYNSLIEVAESLPDKDFEILFVDDGSKDDTLNIIKDLSKTDKRVVYISLSRNFGKEAAMYAGLRHATGNYVALLDADMQDPPSLIPEMYKYITSGEYDSVATRRVSRKGEPFIRSLFAKLFYRIINAVSDSDIVDGARDFRLMNRNMVDSVLKLSEYNRFTKGIFGWIGFRTKWLPYQNIERVAGKTKWNFWKLFKYSLEGIINFSTTPLQIASILGILFCLISFTMIVFIVVRSLIYGDPVAGWPSLASIILFVGGIQLFCTGIMGQYLAKTYLEAKRRPIYIVQESNANEIHCLKLNT